MTVHLDPTCRSLQNAMELNGYATPQEVLCAAFTALAQQIELDDFEPDLVERLLADGEALSEEGTLEADAVFAGIKAKCRTTEACQPGRGMKRRGSRGAKP